MPTEKNGAPERPPEKTNSFPPVSDAVFQKSHESLWGAILFALMILFVAASIAGIGWVAYAKWQSKRMATKQPSISALQAQSNEQENAPASDEPASPDEDVPNTKTDTDNVAAAKKLDMSVLNGGAAKGSAGTIAEFLKTEGYTKVTAGNTLKDYAGIAVYYADGLEKEADAVKASLVKKYPQAKTLPADAKNKETSVSQVTVILGK
ncbi:MAG: hypothetical protein A2878_03150 [Candidatus Moranbacteria bacterium RIFCSPHIGHO2_01_FULL_54_31]|nr:MAG: hypothetical protein A2878_03150 [Candidatus Moranbacteria bacterium RIFCSPHIGHO2_01_FULL_54_31]